MVLLANQSLEETKCSNCCVVFGTGVVGVEFQDFVFEYLAHPFTPKLFGAFVIRCLLPHFGFNFT